MIEISHSVSAVAHGLPDAPKLVIGIVTGGQSEPQLSQLARSIDLAASNLASLPAQVGVLHAGVGWPVAQVPVAAVDTGDPANLIATTNDLMRRAFADPVVQWFLRLQPGCVLHHSALVQLVTASLAHPRTLFEARRFPDEHAKFYCPATGDTAWARGECLLVPRAVYEKIAGFDSNLCGHLADVDYSWRARQAGCTARVCARALYGSRSDRGADVPLHDRASLLAARYLAWKWNDVDAQRTAEMALIDHGHLTAAELSSRPAPTAERCTGNGNVADFADFPSFDRARWEPAGVIAATVARQVRA